ncbi:tetratricopeptide repeat protein [Flavobacterium qiangtangense]|uniref:Tetratricopeptide repeat protein n=1 Tax=Flavobacterium qiangtangense TaxID=1442595 RepID=A0ABW1PMZ1_9FLAO
MSLLEKIESAIYRLSGYNTDTKNSFRNPVFLLLAGVSALAIFLAYSNHFSNGFQFDDAHTIENNYAIREVTIGRFFADGSTFSSMPSNQSYRPYITSENAIDYHLSSGSTKAFHIHIFITFLLCCALLCVFVKKMLDAIGYSGRNQFWALLAASFFGLLCANAETVNYIIQRAEIVAGLYVLSGFVAFQQGGAWRSRYLYLLFPLIGFFAKEMAFVFSPLLFLYVLLMEENADLLHFYRAEEFKKCWRSFVKILPSFILTVVFFIFYSKMLPETFSSGGYDRFKYLITQPLVLCHYILTYFVPYDLSADTDWMPFESLSDYRALAGILAVMALVYLALKTSKNKQTRLFSFGLLWFFISLLPTSSLIPFSEVLNDHRCFIPYIGLTISAVFGVRYLLQSYFGNALKRANVVNSMATITLIILLANAYGVRERNKVWKDDLSLWGDVAEKSPNNGRGLMNYGLALMARGDYGNAASNFNRAAVLNPDYSSVYINLGVLKNATGDISGAESQFIRALACSTANHSSHYFYARFLEQHGRTAEAVTHLKKAQVLAPSYAEAYLLLFSIYHKAQDWKSLELLSSQILATSPDDEEAKKYAAIAISRKNVITTMEEDAIAVPTAQKYLTISLSYFQIGQYEKSISAAENALSLKKDFPEAYNNIGISNVSLGHYDKGIAAYKKALSLNPEFQLAKNNMAQAVLLQGHAATGGNIKTAADYLNQSLEYYNQGNYSRCIEAAKKSNSILPSANAYNNICSAYNQLRQYDKAIKACDKALELDSSHQLANGNRQYALAQKASQ